MQFIGERFAPDRCTIDQPELLNLSSGSVLRVVAHACASWAALAVSLGIGSSAISCPHDTPRRADWINLEIHPVRLPKFPHCVFSSRVSRAFILMVTHAHVCFRINTELHLTPGRGRRTANPFSLWQVPVRLTGRTGNQSASEIHRFAPSTHDLHVKMVSAILCLRGWVDRAPK